MKTATYSYIVVGAGAAGCVVANRLSADPAASVLLLEAGGPDRNPLIHIPVGFTKLTSKGVNWGFSTVPQAQLNNREMWYPQGRTLGGSTSINAMIYIRGNRADYDRWEALGNAGWGYDGVLPYFRKSENNTRLNNEYHGVGGDLNVTQQIQHNPLTRAFVRGWQELGVEFNADVNGATQDGVTFYDVTQRNARRESAATAFLRPAMNRPNLTVITKAQATKLLFEGKKVVGVEYRRGRETHVARADGEVVLSGGAVNSPRLLMLSGIGPADHLRGVGIDVVHDLPGVGQNFQDHMDVNMIAESTPVSYNQEDRWDRAIRHMIQYLLYKTGPMTICIAEAGAFIRSSDAVEWPDVQVHCLPVMNIDHGRQRRKGHGVTINTCHLRPHSVGSVGLRSGDPGDPPLIDPNYLGDSEGYDWKTVIAGFRRGRKILKTGEFAPFVTGEYLPGVGVQSDEEIKGYIRKWARTDYHPVGSCKMGADEAAVVDTQLRVRGLDNLRVIDASIMPKLVSGNTQAPSIMIGEKGAAIMRAGEVV
ncbi:MAG: FAD-dependent oxidoreductase [Chloroflexota bacterium]|nr:FAD-dependent oxidoreductase [Chloroflexota bacterium]MDP6507896.1 FAD-dependent oxidoreductase [Chloroflexota bacterium]